MPVFDGSFVCVLGVSKICITMKIDTIASSFGCHKMFYKKLHEIISSLEVELHAMEKRKFKTHWLRLSVA